MDFQDPTAENIYQAAFVGGVVPTLMVMCLTADDMDEVQGWKTFGSDSWGDEEEEEKEKLEEGEIRETKPRDPWEGDLDRPDSLLPLLQRCMGEPDQAPNLRELVVRCDLALYTKTDSDYMRLYLEDKTKDFYGFAIYETNEYLRTFIRENILDATVDPLEVELLRRRTTRKFSMPTMPLRQLTPRLKRRSIW
ncbi:ccr4 associated factor [Hypoxylon texense]